MRTLVRAIILIALFGSAIGIFGSFLAAIWLDNNVIPAKVLYTSVIICILAVISVVSVD